LDIYENNIFKITKLTFKMEASEQVP